MKEWIIYITQTDHYDTMHNNLQITISELGSIRCFSRVQTKNNVI